jgi:hypothetical protein
MAASLNINDILSQVKQLDKKDQLTLLQRMAYLLKRGEVKKADHTNVLAIWRLDKQL